MKRYITIKLDTFCSKKYNRSKENVDKWKNYDESYKEQVVKIVGEIGDKNVNFLFTISLKYVVL